MPTLDDVVSQLSGAKKFSKLDIIKLDEASSYLTTFSMPFVRYRYLHLPFGISASSDLFQQRMDEFCESLPGVKAIVDDIIVYGHSSEEHDKTLHNLLLCAPEKGVRFNPEKCMIGVSEIQSFGHVISKKGIKADPSKVEAIVNLDPTDCKAKLETLLGMVQYMSKFAIKNDSTMQKLIQTITSGWQELRAKCSPEILEFWNHRDELSFEDDLIFRGQKLLIPPALRQEMVSKVHTGHLGVNKTLERAKDSIFWPGMSKEITEHVLQCTTCLKPLDSNAKEPLIPHEFPDRPFQKNGVDLFHFDGKEYLLTVDYYSRFFEINCLPYTSSATCHSET